MHCRPGPGLSLPCAVCAPQECERILAPLNESLSDGVTLELKTLFKKGLTAREYRSFFDQRAQPPQLWSVSKRRLTWEVMLNDAYPALSTLFGRLASQHATSCSVERQWSIVKALMRPNRSQTAVATLRRQLVMGNAWRLRRRQEGEPDSCDDE